MVASIALECGGKALVCGSRPWRGRRQARFVYIFVISNSPVLGERKPAYGTNRTTGHVRSSVDIGGKADMVLTARFGRD